jgi:hypothetical protein
MNNKFKPGFDLPELTDEVATRLRNVLYTLMDIFEAKYHHQIEKHRHRNTRRLENDKIQ